MRRIESRSNSGMHPPARETIDISRISRGYWDSMILLTAHRLGIFQAAAGGGTAASIARRTKCTLRGLTILLDALAALGFLSKRGSRYRLTSLSKNHLVPGAPKYMGSMLDHQFNLIETWMRLPDIVQNGYEPGKGRRNRTSAEHREFILAMSNIGSRSAGELIRTVDLTGRRSMLDLGGGPGTYAMTLCRAVKGLDAVVFDLPETAEIARELIAEAGMDGRIGVMAGDYHTDDIGNGYDLVLASNIIHSMPPAAFLRLFRKVCRAMQPGGLFIVKDFYLEESRTAPIGSSVFAVNMLVSTESGNSYTAREMRASLAKAGFVRTTIVPFAGQSALYLAHKRKRG